MSTPLLIPIADLRVAKVQRDMPSTLAEPCLLCGRAVFPESAPTRKAARFVEITTDGCIVWPGDGTMASVSNSQGGFPVGADCYRKIQAAARVLELQTEPEARS